MTLDPGPDLPYGGSQTFTKPPPRDAAWTGPELAQNEAWVLTVLRQMFIGPQGWAVAQQLIATRCPLSAVEPTITGFDLLAETLASGARRRIGMIPPQSRAVTADELALLNLLAAAQAGQFAHAMALARWLVVPTWQSRLVSVATALAGHLSRAAVGIERRRSTVARDIRVPSLAS